MKGKSIDLGRRQHEMTFFVRIKAVAFRADPDFRASRHASARPGPTIPNWIPRSSRGTTEGWVESRYDTGVGQAAFDTISGFGLNHGYSLPIQSINPK